MDSYDFDKVTTRLDVVGAVNLGERYRVCLQKTLAD